MNKAKKIILSILLVIPHMCWGGVVLPTGVSEDKLATELLWQEIKQLPADKRSEVTVVLGGGGARGLSHIGVLRVLEQEGVPIDRIIGVSVGALIGALYAGGKSIDQIEDMASQVGWDSLTDYSKTGVFRLFLSDELLSSEKMEAYLNAQLGDLYFKDLKIPFACIATDLRTGDRVVFREGPVALAARASATVPGFFKPVFYRQRYLVDGGLVDNLPTGLVSETEKTFILAIEPRGDLERTEMTNVLNALVRSIEIQRDILLREKSNQSDFLIRPDMGNISVMDVGRSRESIYAGVKAANKAVLDLKKSIIIHSLSLNPLDDQN